MPKLNFPEPFKHTHAPVRNVNELFDQQASFGAKAADRVAALVGSWRFIIVQSFLLMIWVILNSIAWIYHWDPYPFILMNLVLSTQAAFTAPIIMMSQNRQATKDRIEAHNDFVVNQKAEAEIRAILEHLAAQDEALTAIYHYVASIHHHTGAQSLE